MIKLVVFDWNGTILADLAAVVESGNKELEVLGRPPIDIPTYQAQFEVPIINVFNKIGITTEEFTEKSPQIAEAFHSYYEPRVAKARTRRGAREVTKYIHNNKIKQVVLSNHTTEGIYLQLKRLKLLPYFDAVLANETIVSSHFVGKEARLHEYMKENKFSPKQVVIVGDTEEEVKIGRKLGIKTVSITGGYNSKERLQAVKPDVIINTLNELMPILEEI